MNFKKYRPVIKLTTLLLVIIFIHISVTGFSQVTLQFKNASMEKVLHSITEQTGYYVFYQDKNVKMDNISISVKNVSLQEALDNCFKNQPVRYKIIGKTIALSRAPDTVTPETASPPQQSILHGRVTDSAGNPMHGVSVVNSRKGNFRSYTLTDADGKFDLDAQIGDKIIFSYIGYQLQTIAIGENFELAVTLHEIRKELDSVAVTYIDNGYMKILPQQSTGAVSQITTKQYESQINANFLDGIQNKLPGLMINNNIKFNGNNLFSVRGLSTFSAGSSPLIVLDGYATNLSINDLNPNEIKSVTLLKDAAAAAIYGVKASNGVLVVERKEAVQGKPEVNFRTTFAFTPEENYNRYRWAPEDTYLNFIRYAYQDGATASASGLSSTFTIIPGMDIIYKRAAGIITQDQLEESFQDLASYNNINNYKRSFLRTALDQTYNVDVSGGNSFATYYVTGAYTGNKSNQIYNNNHQIQLSTRLNMNFNKRLTLQLIDDYNETQNNAVPVPDINSIYPWEPFQNADGTPAALLSQSVTNAAYNQTLMNQGFLDALYYPLTDIHNITDGTHTLNNRITGNFTYQLGGGFKLLFGGVYEISHSNERYYASANSSVAHVDADYYDTTTVGNKPNFLLPVGGYLKQTSTDMSSYTARAQLFYDKTFGKDHKISAILGTEVNRTINQSNLASYFGYDDQTLLSQPVNYQTLLLTKSSVFRGAQPFSTYSSLFNQGYTDNRYVSGYANAYYTYKMRYSLTGSIRVDQSNLFGTDPKYRYKPLWSAGAAWNIQNETFMQDVHWVHNLKLRISEGFDGNVAKNSIPQIIAQNFTNTNVPGIPPNALSLYGPANGGLRWEQTNNFNIGLDYSIFKGISGSIDYYNKKSTNLLTQVSTANIDPSKGVSANPYSGVSAYLNSGSMENQGLELNLNADWITRKNFNWYTGFVLSYNTNKVTKGYVVSTLTSANASSAAWIVSGNNTSFYIPGYSSGALFSYRFAGLDGDGVPMIYDNKGDVIKKPGSATAPDGGKSWTEYNGTTIPLYSAGMSNRIDIGSFYVYFKLDYFGGNKVRLPYIMPNVARPIAGAENFWTPQNTNTNIMNPLVTGLTTQELDAYQYGNQFVVNGSYITLSAVTLSYDFGKTLFFRKLGFKQFNLLLQANNLYTKGFNKYDYSPATGSFAKRYLTPTYTIGLYTDL